MTHPDCTKKTVCGALMDCGLLCEAEAGHALRSDEHKQGPTHTHKGPCPRPLAVASDGADSSQQAAYLKLPVGEAVHTALGEVRHTAFGVYEVTLPLQESHEELSALHSLLTSVKLRIDNNERTADRHPDPFVRVSAETKLEVYRFVKTMIEEQIDIVAKTHVDRVVAEREKRKAKAQDAIAEAAHVTVRKLAGIKAVT